MSATRKAPFEPRFDALRTVELDALHDGDEWEDSEVSGLDAAMAHGRLLRFDRCRFVDCDFTASQFAQLKLTDVEFVQCNLAGADWSGASLRRVHLSACRASGWILGEAHLRDVAVDRSRIDQVAMRFADVDRLRVDDCEAQDFDATGATLRSTVIIHTRLHRADFTGCTVDGLDLRGSDLLELRGTGALRGATVAPAQLVALAPALAHALGLTVLADDEPR